MPSDVLSYEVRDRKAYIKLNRPKQMNALNHELLSALAEAFQDADASDEVFVVILSAEGRRAFSAGGGRGHRRPRRPAAAGDERVPGGGQGRRHARV
jgi:enoyl-CoA hydratase/carnithine racemase